MPDAQPPYLADALTRFRAAADSAVERGRRVTGDAAAAGAVFQRESEDQVRRLRLGHGPDARDPRPTPADLRDAAAEYRTERGLPVPELSELSELSGGYEPAPPRRPAPPPDEDFSDFRIMGPV